MTIISSTTDLDTYLANAGIADPMNPNHRSEVVSAIQSADHPKFGEDWSAWLEANLDSIQNTIASAH